MILPVAPADVAERGPSVGLFWLVAGTLVVDKKALAEAEPYGECLTYPAGHYERWEHWRALDSTSRRRLKLPAALGTSEYDDWPRGRVVYQTRAARFVIYADRRLQRPTTLHAIKGAFGLGPATIVRSDSHYAKGLSGRS